MLSTDVDGLHGRFLAIDENGQRIFALTASGLTVVQLARVPLAVSTITSGEWVLVGRSHVDDPRQRFSDRCRCGDRRQIGVSNVDAKYAEKRHTLSERRQISGRHYQPRQRNASLDASFTAN